MAQVYKITMVVHYDEATLSDNHDYFLEKEMFRCIGDGMLSPSGEEIVDEYSLDVELVETPNS